MSNRDYYRFALVRALVFGVCWVVAILIVSSLSDGWSLPWWTAIPGAVCYLLLLVIFRSSIEKRRSGGEGA